MKTTTTESTPEMQQRQGRENACFGFVQACVDMRLHPVWLNAAATHGASWFRARSIGLTHFTSLGTAGILRVSAGGADPNSIHLCDKKEKKQSPTRITEAKFGAPEVGKVKLME